MNAIELIRKLNAIVMEHGDLPVSIAVAQEPHNSLAESRDIEVHVDVVGEDQVKEICIRNFPI